LAIRSLRRHALFGGAVLVALVGGLGGWAASSEFAGAVVAPGTVVVESSVKKVQHPTGGVVGELRVRDGDRVRAGDVVVRLDETIVRANLAMVAKALDELSAQSARLEAEREDSDAIEFADDLTDRRDDPHVARVLAGEARLFDLRRSAREGQKAQLRERIAQFREEIEGLAGQADAKKREIALIERELVGTRDLYSKNLTPLQRLVALEREAVRIAGERHQLIAAAAQAKGKVTEAELQILQVEQNLRSDVAKELRDIQAKTAELTERKIAAQDQLSRIDIRAPQSGFVHQLAVHTVGGVAAPGEPLMLIVPEGDDLTVEVKVPPQDIDQVAVGQKAVLRFSAFNQRTTPEIEGIVTSISADITQDRATGVSYYIVRAAMPEAELARLNELKLVPGMPVDAFIRTNQRTVLSYLMQPLEEQVARSFRER
jgi:HlyD family secretion protein